MAGVGPSASLISWKDVGSSPTPATNKGSKYELAIGLNLVTGLNMRSYAINMVREALAGWDNKVYR